MSSHRFIKFTSTAKLRKSLVSKFSRISIRSKKCDQPNAVSCEAQEVQKVERLCKKSVKLRRKKSRKYVITTLSGCGCQSRRVIVIDRIQAESQLPEVCSLQSLPSCSSSSLESKVEKCSEWISSSSFDEMLKFLSSSRDRQEVHYDRKSSVDKNSLELHISPVKFSDLVSKIRRSEQTSTTETIDQKNDSNFQLVRQGSPKSSSRHMTLRQNVSDSRTIFSGKIVRSNAKKSLISKRSDRMTDSLLIMKSSCDPQREFKNSMMEMIVENKIKNGKDMEELLACYLYLNSEDYHDTIIQVFKQIWVELFQV